MVKIKEDVKLTFDDVLIEPTISTVRSRKLVETAVDLQMPNDTFMTLFTPVISSCMDSVTEWDMAIAMAQMGGLGILHRYYPVSEIKTNLPIEEGLPVGVAVTTNRYGQERVKELIDLGFYIFCVDTANGQSNYAAEMVRWIKDLYPSTIVIAGNVATASGYTWLEEAGADMIRVGIGGGSFCTTRTTTGIGMPQLSSILECAEVARVPLIADGGIRRGSDAAKAFAAGADVLMLGGLLAGTKEAPGEILTDAEGNQFKIGRGMASVEAQPGDKVLGYTPEGIASRVPYTGEARGVIERLLGGVRSAMSYVDARNLQEFKEKTTFIRITNAGLSESHPHILTY